MIKFFESENLCHIILENPLLLDDIEMLKSLFKRDFDTWNLEFGRVYNVNIEVIETLYQSIKIQNKNIKIITHKSRLNRYLKGLGFNTKFNSLINQDVVHLSQIEVVLLGGSADSSSKIIEIVKNITLENLTFIIVQHVNKNRVGELDQILRRETNYRVLYAQNGKKIEKSTIYIAPSAHHLLLKEGYFHLDNSEKYNYSKPSISLSYASFSSFYKEKLLVIQECGYANDGVDKMGFLKSNNSKLIIQKIDECEAKPMITNALNLSIEDYIFSLKEIILYIQIIDMKMTKKAWVEFLLDEIYKRYNYDFKPYHKDMIYRRVEMFMLKHRIKNIKDTIGVILFNRSAFKAFFLEVSINVTELFRHPFSFKLMSKFLQSSYKNSHTVKLWSAGCSSGQEVYSLAILLKSLKMLDKSLIYATDFNNIILEEAKNGVYPRAVYDLGKSNFEQIGLESNLDDYVDKNSNYIVINKEIKEKTLFFQHNLVEDSSFNEFDIIICKNVIIYFDVNLQEKVFKLFYDSLKFGGHLVLGESESIPAKFINKFKKCDEHCKIFKKVD